MPENKERLSKHITWVRLKGSGVAAVGGVHVTRVILEPAAATASITIYDGLDATVGKVFSVMHAAAKTTRSLNLGEGVRFDRGVYIANNVGTSYTTVCFYDPNA